MKIDITINTEPTEIRKEDLLNINNAGINGVYVMWDVDGSCLYVGKTNNLRSRMYGHRRESDFYSLIEYLDVYKNSNEFQKDVLETYLINDLRPLFNIAKTFYKQEEYEMTLSDINEEIDELKSEIKMMSWEYDGEHYLEIDPFDEYTLPEYVDEYERDADYINTGEYVVVLEDKKQRLDYLQKKKRIVSLRKSG